MFQLGKHREILPSDYEVRIPLQHIILLGYIASNYEVDSFSTSLSPYGTWPTFGNVPELLSDKKDVVVAAGTGWRTPDLPKVEFAENPRYFFVCDQG